MIDHCFDVVNDNNIKNVEELVAWVPISRATFYGWKLHKLDTLIEAVNNSKIRRKSKILQKCEDSDNAAMLKMAYQLMSDDEERRLLSTNYTDVTTQGDKITMPYELSDKQREDRIKELREEMSGE